MGAPKGPRPRLSSVDVIELCALLPAKAFRKDELVPYEGKSFQHAPKWATVTAYAPAIEHMLEKVNSPIAPVQLSIEGGMAFWLEKQDLEYTKGEIEKAASRIRMMYSQVVSSTG